MNTKKLASINMFIYHKNNKQPVFSCKPDYLGFMGIFLKGVNLGYPVGTPLEIEFEMNKNSTKDQRVSMLVNKAEENGTGLRLKSFDREVIARWKNLLGNILQNIKRTS